MENLALTGMIEGKRGRGRPREKYLDGLVRMTNGKVKTPLNIIRATKDRQKWKSMTDNMLKTVVVQNKM